MKTHLLEKGGIECLLLLAFFMLTVSCQRDLEKVRRENEDNIIIADDFDYSSTQVINLDFTMKDNQDAPLSKVRFQLYTLDEDHEKLIMTAVTDELGEFQGQANIPAYVNKLLLKVQQIGLAQDVVLDINENIIHCNLGGSEPVAYETLADFRQENARVSDGWEAKSARTQTSFNFLGNWNNQGVPDYLEAERDQISAGFLKRVNASLPEGRPVPRYHPDYLKNDVITNIDITQEADVWVTFVHEGAGWRNTLGFYTYPTQSPPQSRDDITEVTIIFPNVSYRGSGGGLVSGDKVNIGRFEAGVSIGFVLFAQGWRRGNTDVSTGIYGHYSHHYLNNEDDPEIRQHNILLYDQEEEILLLGFEDVRRDNTPIDCDNDFNDALFYISSNPVKAIEKSAYLPTDTPQDSDNDGISDTYDDYPNDPEKAFDNFYPGEQSWGVLAFEDLWPGVGDYDFNDLVINYRYQKITDVDNRTTELRARYVIEAVGASYHNGFGIQLEVPPSQVAQVSGQRYVSDYLEISGNGTEAGQRKAVIIPFDDAFSLVSRPPGFFVNTQNEAPQVTSDTLNISVTFNNPVSVSALGTIPFNPFIIINQDRGRELHLPDQPPTDKASVEWIGTNHDSSNPRKNRFYKTRNNRPWGLHFLEDFAYPLEGKSISSAYYHFSRWAGSSGNLHKGWYQRKAQNLDKLKVYRFE